MNRLRFSRSRLRTVLSHTRIVPSLVISSLTLLTAPHASAVMMDIGNFPGAGAIGANAISGDGRVVVGRTAIDPAYSTFQPFSWSADRGFSYLPAITRAGVFGTAAMAASRDGLFVAGAAYGTGGFSTALRWSAGSAVELGTLGGTSSAANGISDDGSVVIGWADTATKRHAFRWQANTMQDLGALGPVQDSYANDVSGDGAVVVGQSGKKAFRWDAINKMVDLGNLGGATLTVANGTNRDGSVVVGNSSTANGSSHAFRWTATSTLQDLGTLGGTTSTAQAVNADGSVVVGSANQSDGATRAYRWTAATSLVSLGVLSGATDSTATDVSDDGNTIVGNSGKRAFIWRAATVNGQLAAGIQDLGNLQTSHVISAQVLGHLTTAQNRRIRDLNQPQCIPGALQQYCLSLGATGYRGEGDSSGVQKIGQVATGLRLNEHFTVGANASVADANLHSQRARQESALGLSLWAAYQQNPDDLGWTGTASVATGKSDNSFERGTDMADVQRARATSKMSSTGMRAAVGYGVKVATTVVTPELAISHVNTDHNGFTERNVAFPLTVEGGSSADTYATFGVRSVTPLSPKASLHLGAALDVLMGDHTDAIEGHSQVPGLSNFKVDSTVDKRAVVPVAMAGYRYALDANSSVGAQVQVGAGAYYQQKTMFGVGVQYTYAF